MANDPRVAAGKPANDASTSVHGVADQEENGDAARLGSRSTGSQSNSAGTEQNVAAAGDSSSLSTVKQSRASSHTTLSNGSGRSASGARQSATRRSIVSLRKHAKDLVYDSITNSVAVDDDVEPASKPEQSATPVDTSVETEKEVSQFGLDIPDLDTTDDGESDPGKGEDMDERIDAEEEDDEDEETSELESKDLEEFANGDIKED